MESKVLTEVDKAASYDEFTRRLYDDDLLTARINQAVRTAVLGHKAAGYPVCTWEDGKVVWIQPEDINLPDIWTPGDNVNISDR